MSNAMTAVRHLSALLLTTALLGQPGALAREADPPVALSAQVTAMAGTDLMFGECQERLQTLDSLLTQAGYGAMRSQLEEGGTLVARWYHPQRHTTVIVSSGWQASGNAFTATEFAGVVRWIELLGTP
jgi:hypothetical protein